MSNLGPQNETHPTDPITLIGPVPTLQGGESMSDTGAPNPPAKISWKQIWLNILVAAITVVAINAVWSACGWLYSHFDYQPRYDQRDTYRNDRDGMRLDWGDRDRQGGIDINWGGRENRRPFDSGREIERFVEDNLPPRADSREIDAVANVFDRVASMAEDGTLIGRDDTFAELNRNLQAVCTQREWVPFFTGLVKITDRIGKDAPEDNAELLRRIGAALRSSVRRPRTEPALNVIPPDAPAPVEPAKPATEPPVNEPDEAEGPKTDNTKTVSVPPISAPPTVILPAQPNIPRESVPTACPGGNCYVR